LRSVSRGVLEFNIQFPNLLHSLSSAAICFRLHCHNECISLGVRHVFTGETTRNLVQSYHLCPYEMAKNLGCHHACHQLLEKPKRRIPSTKAFMCLARIRKNEYLWTLPPSVLQMILVQRNHIGVLKLTNKHNSSFHHSIRTKMI
jgi:hypothetical protein